MCNMCGNLIIGLCWTKCSADCSITNEIFAHIISLTLNVQSLSPSFTFLRHCTLMVIRNSWSRGSINNLVPHILRASLREVSHPSWF